MNKNDVNDKENNDEENDDEKYPKNLSKRDKIKL